MFEIASWWKHKHKQVFCKKTFGFIFSFIGKWNCTSNDFSANFHQNSAENILLGRNLGGKKKKRPPSLGWDKALRTCWDSSDVMIPPCSLCNSLSAWMWYDGKPFLDFCGVCGLAAMSVSFQPSMRFFCPVEFWVDLHFGIHDLLCKGHFSGCFKPSAWSF